MLICSQCQQTCRAKVIDEGIGYYEYAGAPGYQTKLRECSTCCEAEIVSQVLKCEEEE